MINNITSWLTEEWGLTLLTQKKILFSLITLIVLTLIRFAMLKFVARKIDNVKTQYYWRNGIKNGYNSLLIIIISLIWIEKMDSVGTFLGLIGAGLAIALQDPIINLAAWVFIVIKKPFDVGDRIEIDKMAGDVIDMGYFQFTINEINNWVDADQSTGRIIHIPNGRVFKAPQANFNQGFMYIWNEIGILITFESDWKLAKKLFTEVVEKHTEHLSEDAKQILYKASQKYMIYYNNLTPVIYTSVKDSGVMLTMRYLCNPKKRRVTEHQMWEDLLEIIAREEKVNLAYPTQRLIVDRKKPQSYYDSES